MTCVWFCLVNSFYYIYDRGMVWGIAFSLMCVSPCISACAYPGPFSSQLSTLFALEEIAGHRMQLEALKQEECTILQGLEFFKIEWTPSKTIQMLEKVLHITMFIVLHPTEGYWGNCVCEELAQRVWIKQACYKLFGAVFKAFDWGVSQYIYIKNKCDIKNSTSILCYNTSPLKLACHLP